MDAYYTVAEIETACLNLAAQYPTLARSITLPELTPEGRTSRALHISTSGWNSGAPALMVVAGLHAREWGCSEVVLNLAADLLGALALQVDLDYGGGQRFRHAAVSALLANLDVVLFPLVNPDGRHHSQTVDALWRKNRSLGHAGEDPATIGVDLNRNFDFLFDLQTAFVAGALGSSVSDDAATAVYQGPSAWSEPETRNLRWLIESHPGLRGFVDLHSGALGVLYPWSDDETQSAHPAQSFQDTRCHGKRGLEGDAYAEFMPAADVQRHADLADVFCAAAHRVDGQDWAAVPAFKFQPSCGTSHDWVYAQRLLPGSQLPKRWAFAVECFGGPGWAPWPDEMPPIIRSVCAGLLAMTTALVQPPAAPPPNS